MEKTSMLARIGKSLIFLIVILGLVIFNLGFRAHEALTFGFEPVNLPANLSDSVVAIDMYQTQYDINYSYDFYRFSRQISQQRQRVASGTGFIVNSDGYLLTNAHVVFDPDAQYIVSLDNGKQYQARIVYRDTAKDIAVMKIDASNLSVAALGDSSRVKIGQDVVGIGNALGAHANVSANGSVTGVNERIVASGPTADEHLSNLISSDTQLYPGDSGGPLFNSSGQVIGINVAVAQDVVQSFTIPINTAKAVLAEANISL